MTDEIAGRQTHVDPERIEDELEVLEGIAEALETVDGLGMTAHVIEDRTEAIREEVDG